MARLTVEDCLEYVKNRFDLVIKAAKRARNLERGAEPLVDWDNDKPTVVALREIAGGLEPTEPKKEEENPFQQELVEESVSEEIKAELPEEMPVESELATPTVETTAEAEVLPDAVSAEPAAADEEPPVSNETSQDSTEADEEHS